MESPPSVLAGLYVVEFAEVDDSVVFEQRWTLNVDGQWLGRVRYLAICQEFATLEYVIQYCEEGWEPVGIAAGYTSVEEAKARIERSYHGIGSKWVGAKASFVAARVEYEADLRASACSFCGRTPPEEAQRFMANAEDTVRICSHCIADFHAAIHTQAGVS
jgi:hypothetical protein